jgi:hypothetical protein
MRLERFIGLASLGLLGLGAFGCSGSSDPVAASVAASGGTITVAPEATQGPEAAAKAQEEIMRKQAQADRAAHRRRR